MKTKSENPDAGKTVCGIRCVRNLIAVAEYGQEDVTRGGIYIPEGRQGGLLGIGPDGMDADKDQFWRYRFGEWRFGEVISIGNGFVDHRYSRSFMDDRRKQRQEGHPVDLPRNPIIFHEPPPVRIGDVVVFSRKHGAKVGYYYDHPQYGSLLIRFLDPEKTVAIWDDFEPWWNVADTQVRPDRQFYG